MFKLVLLVVALAASANAIWLYTADTYNLNFNLYAIDTTTFRTYTIGKVRDASGDTFTVSGMHYHNGTGLIYAIGNGRASNPEKRGGIMAINPATAQVVWFTNCTDNPFGQRFQSMMFDTSRRQFVFTVIDDPVNSRNATYLNEADMIAGNCSKMALRWPTPSTPTRNYWPSAAEYLPQWDVMVWTRETDRASSQFHFWDLSVNTTTPVVIQSTTLRVDRYTNRSIGAGDFYRDNDGTIWELGREYGPGKNYLYQYDFGTNLTQLITGERLIGMTIFKDIVIPRALGGLTAGPAPSTRTLWTTKYSGSVLLVNPANELWEVNLNTPEKRKVATLSQQVTAIESFGTWDTIVAVVNSSNTATLSRVNITTGALTQLTTLPALFTSLTRSSNGKLVAFRNVNDTWGEYAIINSTGAIESTNQIQCASSDCSKAMVDTYGGNTTLYTVGELNTQGTAYLWDLTSDPITSIGSRNLVDGCPETPDGGYSCTNWYGTLTRSSLPDFTSAGAGYGYVVSRTVAVPFASIFYVNMTTGRADNIVDLPEALNTLDMAHFQYNSAWCNNKGNYVGNACACNAGFGGSRCEIVLPPPVAVPVAPPVAGAKVPTSAAQTTSVNLVVAMIALFALVALFQK